MDTPVGPVDADRHRARTGHRESCGRRVRWGLLVAITIGVFFGAMACATNMAAASGPGSGPGSGHGVHASVGGARTGDSGARHHDHASVSLAAGAGPSASPDGAVGSSTSTHGHPGAACMMSVQLRVATLVVNAHVSLASARLMTPPPDCAMGPEPPVPRFS